MGMIRGESPNPSEEAEVEKLLSEKEEKDPKTPGSSSEVGDTLTDEQAKKLAEKDKKELEELKQPEPV